MRWPLRGLFQLSGFAGHLNSYLLTPISYLCGNKKALRPNDFWDERPAFRGTTRIRIFQYALVSG